jgi:DNA-directed RNA polymerase subunit RPC12/RpoP
MDKIRIAAGVADEHYLPEEFAGMRSCPHCQTRRPGLRKTYAPKGGLFSHVLGDTIHWAIYVCSTCGLPISIVHRKARNPGAIAMNTSMVPSLCVGHPMK